MNSLPLRPGTCRVTMVVMSEENILDYPYKSLGKSIRGLREKLRETVAEVSGAVEIEIDALNRIEMGAEKPSEDILLLLISHFGIKEEEAAKLWEMAQYEQQTSKETDTNKPGALVMPTEARIAYTDIVYTVANQYGLVINFMQENGPAGQPLIVSRVGMSKDHARSMIQVLQQALEGSAPKALPTSSRKSKQKSQKKSQKKTDH